MSYVEAVQVFKLATAIRLKGKCIVCQSAGTATLYNMVKLKNIMLRSITFVALEFSIVVLLSLLNDIVLCCCSLQFASRCVDLERTAWEIYCKNMCNEFYS